MTLQTYKSLIANTLLSLYTKWATFAQRLSPINVYFPRRLLTLVVFITSRMDWVCKRDVESSLQNLSQCSESHVNAVWYSQSRMFQAIRF